MNPWFSEDGRLRAGWRFLLGAVVALVANFIAIGVATSIARGRVRILEGIYRPLTMLLLLAGFGLLLVTADRVHEGIMRALGLGRVPGWRRQAGLGIAIGTGLVCLSAVWIAITGDLLIVSLKVNNHTLGMAAAVLLILATGALAEELMFRSYPFQRLLESVGAAPATLVMALLFAVAHGANPHASKLAMLNTFAIGVLLCVAYLRTRALWLPWGIHFAWNTTLGMVFGLPVSGLTDFAVIIRMRAVGPRWVTGGAYGIEGSVVGTLVILMGFIPLILLTRRRAEARREPSPAAQADWDEPGASDQPSAPRIQL